jgi:hypothetical protein
LAKALAVEGKARDKVLAAVEAEEARRGARNVTRAELEAVQTRLARLEAVVGIEIQPVPEVAARQRQQAAADHLDQINQRYAEREAAELAAEPERRARMAERAQRDFDHMDRVNRGEHLRGR